MFRVVIYFDLSISLKSIMPFLTDFLNLKSVGIFHNLYIFPSILLCIQFVCTLDRSALFSSVKPVCQTTALCSKILLIYDIFIVFRSEVGTPNSASFCNKTIRAFSLPTTCVVLLSQVRSFDVIVPWSFDSYFHIFSI